MFVFNNAWTIAVVLLVKWNFGFTESLECFTCTDARNMTECVLAKVCGQNEHCFTNVTGHGENSRYNLGCMNLQTCLGPVNTPSPVQTIVGRDVQNAECNCNQCCNKNYCNRQLCSHLVDVTTDPTCRDDTKYNCELISSTFNICQDIHHAKITCRKWCGLCGLVDGAWSDWTAWSNCDVSCSSGHKSRTRKCTNPKPEQGGLDCTGDRSEIATCKPQSCPVHGNWSQWSSWGACSVSCGVGLERRDRRCSNPYPGPQGSPCLGDARDDRVCIVKACTDGNWSTWGSWGDCSTTCGGGIQERNRNCDNPAPSVLGNACTGNENMYVSCNTKACPVPLVYFTAQSANSSLVSEGGVSKRPIFTRVTDNVGGGYNQTTAIFVCPVSGLYHFYFSFIHASTNANLECYLFHNSSQVARAYAGPALQSNYKQASASIYANLNKGDTFSVGSCFGWAYVNNDLVMFTGTLINAT